MHHIEVFLIYLCPIQTKQTPIQICTRLWRTKLATNPIIEVVCEQNRSGRAVNSTETVFSVFSATESIKNRASTSQHSSISQTNDSNSPYARVRSTSHAYDKVRSTEHPYAQLKNADSSTSNTSPSTSGAADSSQDMSSSRNSSHQNLLEVVDRQTQRVSQFEWYHRWESFTRNSISASNTSSICSGWQDISEPRVAVHDSADYSVPAIFQWRFAGFVKCVLRDENYVADFISKNDFFCFQRATQV